MKKLLLLIVCSIAVSNGFSQTSQSKLKKDTAKTEVQRTVIRVPFNQIFKENDNGSFSPLYTVFVNGVTMSPGVSFSAGVLAVDTVKGKVILKGHY